MPSAVMLKCVNKHPRLLLGCSYSLEHIILFPNCITQPGNLVLYGTRQGSILGMLHAIKDHPKTFTCLCLCQE